METVSWDQFTWVIGTLVTLNLAIGGVAFGMLRGKAGSPSVSRLWASHTEDKDALAAYKVEVARTHPTKPEIADVETRLKSHMDSGFKDIKELIRGRPA